MTYWKPSKTWTGRRAMTNADVIQSMTVKELANLLRYLTRGEGDSEKWLKADSQKDKGGLLTDEMKKFWKVH